MVEVPSQRLEQSKAIQVVAARATPLFSIKRIGVDVPRFELGASTMPR